MTVAHHDGLENNNYFLSEPYLKCKHANAILSILVCYVCYFSHDLKFSTKMLENICNLKIFNIKRIWKLYGNYYYLVWNKHTRLILVEGSVPWTTFAWILQLFSCYSRTRQNTQVTGLVLQEAVFQG